LTDAIPLLLDRVDRLDRPPVQGVGANEVHGDVVHFVRTMQAVTRPADIRDVRRLPTTAPERADAAARQCRLLQRLAAARPGLAVGPLDRTHQCWIASERPDHLAARWPTPDADRFVPPAAEAEPQVGPLQFGLFSSTCFDSAYGMWWTYLELNSGSILFRRPWRVWALDIPDDARVLEINGAGDWVRFAQTYPEVRDGIVHVDWAGVAADWDGVHMTCRAIAATQGIWFPSGPHVVAAPFWDVESTFWLRWVFSDARLIAEVAG
jgi:hypothetical protein